MRSPAPSYEGIRGRSSRSSDTTPFSYLFYDTAGVSYDKDRKQACGKTTKNADSHALTLFQIRENLDASGRLVLTFPGMEKKNVSTERG